MLRTPLFFPPNRGKNHIWQYFPEAACGAIFWIIIYKQQFLQSDWVKNISINPKSVEYYQCHAKPHSICFFTTISKITKEFFAKTCWQLNHRVGPWINVIHARTWKCTRCIMQMSCLYALSSGYTVQHCAQWPNNASCIHPKISCTQYCARYCSSRISSYFCSIGRNKFLRVSTMCSISCNSVTQISVNQISHSNLTADLIFARGPFHVKRWFGLQKSKVL